MKPNTLIILFSYLLITTTWAIAQNVPSQAPETRLLQHLLQMDDPELNNLRQTIERIQKMSPEEKAQLSDRIGKIHKMPPEKVDAMRKRFESIPKEQREAMRNRWMKMSPEERIEWREKLKNMSHAERKAVFEDQGFMPPRPNRDKKGPPKQHIDNKEPRPESDPEPTPNVENEEN